MGLPVTEELGTDVKPVDVTVKGRDCWWTVMVIDPIAVPLVRALRGASRVTPNALTGASVIVAVAAAAAFATGHLAVGGLLFQASFLLDCMDGKLAQARGMRNRYGRYLDAVGDGIRFASCAGGLVFALAPDYGKYQIWTLALAMFPTLHYVRLTTQAAWPDGRRAAALALPASSLAAVRAIPNRLSKPGTTVDTEALAFTIAPILGAPLAGVAAAAAIDGARLLASLAVHVWQSIRSPELVVDTSRETTG